MAKEAAEREKLGTAQNSRDQQKAAENSRKQQKTAETSRIFNMLCVVPV
jgi:hypothetical protein